MWIFERRLSFRLVSTVGIRLGGFFVVGLFPFFSWIEGAFAGLRKREVAVERKSGFCPVIQDF